MAVIFIEPAVLLLSSPFVSFPSSTDNSKRFVQLCIWKICAMRSVGTLALFSIHFLHTMFPDVTLLHLLQLNVLEF
ncbi:MAG: hypothetical protein ABI675_06305 [Chitinophagaceae bacterium]